MNSYWLLQRYGPTMDMRELAKTLKRSVKTLRNDISAGKCPVKTFKIQGTRVAPTESVAKFLMESEKAAA